MRYLKCLIFALLLTSWGCAGMDFMGSSTEEPSAPEQSSFFYDFNDIRVPEEMEILPDESSITPSESGKYGTIRFQGWAEPTSLFDYFFNNMPKDGWTLVTYQKYERYFLVFSKGNRVCMISIEDRPFWYTKLEIKVTPRVVGTNSPAYSTGAQPMDTYPSSGATLDSERTLAQ